MFVQTRSKFKRDELMIKFCPLFLAELGNCVLPSRGWTEERHTEVRMIRCHDVPSNLTVYYDSVLWRRIQFDLLLRKLFQQDTCKSVSVLTMHLYNTIMKFSWREQNSSKINIYHLSLSIRSQVLVPVNLFIYLFINFDELLHIVHRFISTFLDTFILLCI
jgi:hypothetical protein